MVIRVQTTLGDHVMTSEMSGRFAALMIQQVTHLLDQAAVADRRTQYLVGLVQVSDQKSSGSPQLERRPLQKTFPIHASLFQLIG
jgi:hypothetical protein